MLHKIVMSNFLEDSLAGFEEAKGHIENWGSPQPAINQELKMMSG